METVSSIIFDFLGIVFIITGFFAFLRANKLYERERNIDISNKLQTNLNLKKRGILLDLEIKNKGRSC